MLRPEVPRTLHYGTHGTSNNQFGSFLASGALHSEPPSVDWTAFDASAMSAAAFEARYIAAVCASTKVGVGEGNRLERGREYRVEYKVRDPSNFDVDKGGEWPGLASKLGLMSDIRGGTPRSAYKGVVQSRTRTGARLYAAPAGLCGGG